MIHVGTSGFSYSDWKGRFYPPGLPSRDNLRFYAGHFTALEVNFTYYRLPAAGQLRSLAARSGDRLILTVKANRDMTHTGRATEGDYAAFRAALEPLAESGLLGTVLAQFPWSFRAGAESRGALASVAERLRPFPVVVEFRHASWASRETFSFLRERGIGFCAVDEPKLKGLFPAVTAVTSPVAYVRFHGRNARSWWRHREAHERYDYLYTRSQLEPWVPRIRAMDRQAERTFVFANNHYEAKAVTNAVMLQEMLAATAPG